MTDTTRDLIQRMAKELDLYRQMARNDCISTHPFADEARAYLAQSEPEGPTDEELLRTYGLAKRNHCYEGPIDDWPKRAERAATVHGLRAVIAADRARWGRPAIGPVPVSERLPGEEDCDPSFQCWWFTPSEEKWILWPIKWAGPECSHWLPHHALPVPTL